MPEIDLIKITQDTALLRQVSLPAAKEDADYLFPRMELLLATYPHGAGLSAVQVGRPVRLFIVKLHGSYLRFLNPVVVNLSEQKEWGEEGCLSLPGYRRLVRRHVAAEVSDALREQPQVFSDANGGILARVVQHELDHLDGKILMDVGKPAHGRRR